MEISKLILMLFHARTQAHVWHLQVTPKALAPHLALNEFYDDVVGITDRLAESYQGKYGIIQHEKVGLSVDNFRDVQQIITYLKIKVEYVEKCREGFKDGYLQQIIDEIIELFYSKLYKLQNL